MKIVIIGAGPSGIGLGYALNLNNKNFIIFEKENWPGGLSSSFTTQKGFTFDLGGHVGFSKDQKYLEIYKSVLRDNFLTHPRNAWIYYKNGWVPYPFQENLSCLSSDDQFECLLGLYKAMGNKDKRPDNFKQFLINNFGQEIAEKFMIPYNKKVWAYDLEKMDFKWIGERISCPPIDKILQNVIFKESTTGWGPNNEFYYPKKGTGDFFSRVSELFAENFVYGRSLSMVNLEEKSILLDDGKIVKYDHLVSTLPINKLLEKCKGISQKALNLAGNFVWNKGVYWGFGVKGKCPSDKTWVYFSGDEPFYRVTYLSNYSPFLVPDDEHFSILAEVSIPYNETFSEEEMKGWVLESIESSGIIKPYGISDIVDIWCGYADFSYPVPFLGRDRCLKRLKDELIKHDIYSIGRFGSWKYEIGNMDHSFMEGYNLAEQFL